MSFTQPKYRLFFMSVTPFGRDKIGIQKIKKQFFSKISSIQRLIQVTSLFSYTWQLEKLLSLVFLLILGL